MSRKAIVTIGDVFGSNTILEQVETRDGDQYVLVQCNCGSEPREVKYSALKRGKTKGCPMCAKKTHGLSYHPLFGTHTNMMRRCTNKNDRDYHNYGGRGIKVCPEWYDPQNYIDYIEANLGDKPSPKHEIDRRDNNGNYCPGNVRWVTRAENNRNRRDNKLTISDAREIRELYKTGNYTNNKLAEMYKVVQSVISAIINNKIWKESA